MDYASFCSFLFDLLADLSYDNASLKIPFLKMLCLRRTPLDFNWFSKVFYYSILLAMLSIEVDDLKLDLQNEVMMVSSYIASVSSLKASPFTEFELSSEFILL